MTKKDWKLKKIGSILLFLFIISSFSLFYFPPVNNNSSKGESIENSEELRLSATAWTLASEVVSTESKDDSLNPAIAVDIDGTTHVVWDDSTIFEDSGSDTDIIYKRQKFRSRSWPNGEVVSTESDGNSTYPTIAVDYVGNVHVAWQDKSNYSGAYSGWDIFYKRWNATSRTWTMTEVISIESTADSVYPSIAADNAKNVHLVWQDRTNYSGAGPDWDIFYRRWSDISSTWGAIEVVSTVSIGDSEFPTIAVDDVRNVHVTWDDSTIYDGSGSDQDIFYKRWNATSFTWTTTEVVSTESDSESYSPTIAVNATFYVLHLGLPITEEYRVQTQDIIPSATGNAYIAWYDYSIHDMANPGWDVFYKLWNATSNTWTTTEVISTESTGDSLYPAIAVDSYDNVHLVWFDITNGVSLDVFYKLWNATSNTWTTTEMVSTESDDYSCYPTIAVEGGGNAHVAWDDSTNYQNSGTDHDIFHKQSNPLLSGPGALEIPGYNIFLLIGIICVVSVILFKKRYKNKV